jgi:DNA polymerase-3 subunit delta'
VKQSFRRDLEQGKLSHAYLLEGPQGSGKTLLAKTICADLAQDEVMIRKIFEDISPDVRVLKIPSGRKTIGVEEIRNLRSSAYIKANDLDFKAYIIQNCEKMTVQAQNALLKLLEEPPTAVYFFLLCESSTALLATVRSRAPTIRMQTFDPKELASYLLSNDPQAKALQKSQPDGFESLLSESGGSIGAALSLLNKRSAQKENLQESILHFYTEIFTKKKSVIYLSCLSLPSKREDLTEWLTRARLALRDLLVLRCQGTSELLFGKKEELLLLSKKVSLPFLVEVDRALESALLDVSSNLNLMNVRLALATDICERLN